VTVEAPYLFGPDGHVKQFDIGFRFLPTVPALRDIRRWTRSLAYAHLDAARIPMYFVSALVWPDRVWTVSGWEKPSWRGEQQT